ncbi:Ribosomal protein S18 acetylase RimI [Rhodovulum sp. ES.010]|uniref:GNAT family N-acetyltransferase n=1 Tax=Rhodovulum sp. ES.010 TaxID=1882821 RepID=UPI00092851EF|nr:GNAT family N-acetyltransferase [Rhodovulum sp. ES.010]SIO30608.1 Ribosomal protein S18 acetylase RimI [Rhodovulum sp. ES.010]
MILREMTLAELDRVLDWAAEEGWNPGLDDAAPFHAADPAGFFVAEIGGAPVAAISVVNHTEGYAFLGLYLCRPAYRGRGIGHALWRHALGHAGDRVVGLDGVPAQQDNYRRSGFVYAAENTRFAGPLPPGDGPELRPVAVRHIPHLAALEAEANGAGKTAFLTAWLRPAETRQTLALPGEGVPAAFVTLRRCRAGYKIGPLVAPSLPEAQALLAGAARLTGDAPVMIDLPGDQTALAAVCGGLGMVPCFSTARMYVGPPPVPGPAIRALATLELG